MSCFFDYGVRDKDIKWANADASKIVIKLQDGKYNDVPAYNYIAYHDWYLRVLCTVYT